MDIAIHANLQLTHQADYAEALLTGFCVHGENVFITPDTDHPATVHVVIGPHFAKQQCLKHPNVILVDRCYYRGDPEHVSIGWMNRLGGRNFVQGGGRPPPTPKQKKTGRRTLFLADYRGLVEQADTIRLHPAQQESHETLMDALSRHDIAIGYNTTALVTAALEGLQVICKSKLNIMSQKNWLELLPYADWGFDEIASGAAWEHLIQSQRRLSNPLHKMN